ncbi:MAG: hypothetical protein Q8M16_10260 [Pirellulaceae bacterium]|nr:hypothetical protein [Pirellulaceae bacterium]
MNSLVRISTFVAFAAAMLLCASPQLAFAQKSKPPVSPPPIKYKITFLDASTTLWDINEAGAAAGWISTGSDMRAIVRLADGDVVDLTTVAQNSDPNYAWSLLDYAVAINESGQIAGRGWRIENGVPHARLFRYSPTEGVLEAIRNFDSGSTLFAQGMNDYGDVVVHAAQDGQSTLPSEPDAGDSVWVFSGAPGQGVAVHLLDSAVPAAINNFGEVAGAIDVGTRSAAFRFAPAQASFALFGTINGNTSSRYQVSDGLAINDHGTLAGWACTGKIKSKDNTSQRAVRLRSDGTWEDLMSSANNSWVRSINNHGDTVGFGAATGTGFIHFSGKLYSLRDLITNPPANLKNVYPKVIVDGGQICGAVLLQHPDGTTSESGVILTPVP